MLRLSDFYKFIFGCKAYKISLDAGCTCPNRDGTKGVGGCIFCSQNGSGDFAAEKSKPIKEQVEEAKSRIEAKLRGRSGTRRGKYIAYFQNFTSTYGNARELEQKYLDALKCENVAGIAIATRPDCVSDEILEAITKISQKYFVQIELGLQTSNEETGKLINRCYTNEDYENAVRKIKSANPKIHIVTHLIFGLPFESEEDMMKSVDFVIAINNSELRMQNCANGAKQAKENSKAEIPHREHRVHGENFEKENILPQSGFYGSISCLPENLNDQKTLCVLPSSVRNSMFGIKITSLYVLKNTKLFEMWKAGEYEAITKERYFDLLKKALARLPENVVIHRLTGDPPKSLLAAPSWTTDKKRVMNEIKDIL